MVQKNCQKMSQNDPENHEILQNGSRGSPGRVWGDPKIFLGKVSKLFGNFREKCFILGTIGVPHGSIFICGRLKWGKKWPKMSQKCPQNHAILQNGSRGSPGRVWGVPKFF